MKHLLLVVAVLTACKSSSARERSAPAPAPEAPKAAQAAPAPAPTPAPQPAAEPATGPMFKPFEDALLGNTRWLPDGGKRGIVELIAVDDLSGRTKGTFTVTRRCGADAVAVMSAIDKQLGDREASHDPVACSGEGGLMTCVQGGNGEGDTAIEVIYRQDAEGVWKVLGVKHYRMGVTMDQQEAQFAKLAEESCGQRTKAT